MHGCLNMMTLRTASRVSLWLGLLSLAALVLANMALLDIYHGEADTTLEWNVVRGRGEPGNSGRLD